MKITKIARRFLIPAALVSVRYYFKYGCFISTKAEVELSPNLKIGPRTAIGSFAKIKSSEGPLHIGADVTIATGCAISSGKSGIIIGDDCLIASNACIFANNHRFDRLDVPIRLQENTSKGIRIGDNVWIGVGACILDGSMIGNGSIITPNSVVGTKIPDNSIVQGNPGKVIFTRR
jgi:acetyltransferase-like isoleucine patch superfamily enzyme